MNKNSKFKDFLIKLIENVVIQVLLVLVIALGGMYILKNSILSFLLYIQQTFMPLWMTIAIVIVVIFLSRFLLKKRHHIPLPRSSRIRGGNEQEMPFSYNDLNWIAYIPRQLFNIDEYVWLKGPFCPDCAYELKWKGGIRKSWYCEQCNKNFETFKKSARDERRFVESVIYAEAFRKKKFQDRQK
jgi:uncharacterized membrane protein/ribosomal protein L37AE/L43A